MIGRETRPSQQKGKMTIDQTVVGQNECHDLHQSKRLRINWCPSSEKGEHFWVLRQRQTGNSNNKEEF
jgi:hypothetical protein